MGVKVLTIGEGTWRIQNKNFIKWYKMFFKVSILFFK